MHGRMDARTEQGRETGREQHQEPEQGGSRRSVAYGYTVAQSAVTGRDETKQGESESETRRDEAGPSVGRRSRWRSIHLRGARLVRGRGLSLLYASPSSSPFPSPSVLRSLSPSPDPLGLALGQPPGLPSALARRLSRPPVPILRFVGLAFALPTAAVGVAVVVVVGRERAFPFPFAIGTA